MTLLYSGKVRDVYEIDENTLLFVTTDRVSAYDVVLASAIPDKGALLTLLTAHWSRILCERLPNLRTHFLALGLPREMPKSLHDVYQNRAMQVQKLQVFKIEAIVRGYLTREAWDSYQVNGTVCGIQMRAGLREGQAFPGGPIYTPSTKADPPEHDEDISEEEAALIVGKGYADRIKELSLSVYKCGAAYALERGIIIADTKFEFGLDTKTDEVVLVDEILTPESSRFWPVEGYRVGQDSLSLDKQYLRDWLAENGLAGMENVELSTEVVEELAERYKIAFEELVGKTFDEVVGRH